MKSLVALSMLFVIGPAAAADVEAGKARAAAVCAAATAPTA